MKLIPVYSSNGKKLVAYREAEEIKKRRRRRASYKLAAKAPGRLRKVKSAHTAP